MHDLKDNIFIDRFIIYSLLMRDEIGASNADELISNLPTFAD